MHPYKFQVPENSKNLRGQVFSYLYNNFDTITINSQDQIDPNRYLAFSHPFDDWVFDEISKNKKLNFFHIDNGYIGNHLYKTPYYYRISYNSLQNTKPYPVSTSRISKLEIDNSLWQDWNLKGKYNLLVMSQSSNIFKYLGKNYNTWREETIEKYNNLDVPLIIREKQGKRKQRFKEILPMIKEAKKVITYHSMAAVESLCLGTPVEILGQSAVQHWQNQTNFDRQEMLEHIAWSQFSRDEFANGTAWKCTFKYQVENNV